MLSWHFSLEVKAMCNVMLLYLAVVSAACILRREAYSVVPYGNGREKWSTVIQLNWIVYFCFIFPSLDVIISCRGHVVEISVCVFFSGQILVLIRGWNIYIYKFVFVPLWRFCELTIIFTSSQASRLLARFPKTGCFISKEADSVRVDWNILPFSHRSTESVPLKISIAVGKVHFQLATTQSTVNKKAKNI